jgi:hypothetical protein
MEKKKPLLTSFKERKKKDSNLIKS